MKSLPKLGPRKWRDPLSRSQMMARVRSADTVPEMTARAAVFRLGHRFRKNVSDLPGKPDMANKSRRWAIFVHGCFWHGHENCRIASKPKTNGSYWSPKLQRNKDRDAKNLAQLGKMGFRVLVVWECESKEDSKLVEKIKAFFSS